MPPEPFAPTPSPSVVMLAADRQVDRRILLEADSLESAGWHVTILTMPHDAPANNDDPRVVRLAASRETLLVGGYRLARRLLPMNGVVMRAAKALTWRFVADPEKLYANLFLETALKYRPTVFLAHDLPMLPVAAQAAAATGAKFAYDSHELFAEQEFSAHERDRWIEIERKYIGGAALVTTINPSIAREMQQRYGLAEIGVIHNAERLQTGAPTAQPLHERLGLGSGAKVLLFQGGIIGNRNLDIIVAAMAKVSDPAIHLLFLGDGQLAAGLAAQARRLGVSQKVLFRPAVPQSELLGWTAGADIGLVPYQATSLNSYYCTPNKLFEFIAAGVPLLASDLPELRRIVIGNGIGAVANMSDANAAAAAISAGFADSKQLAEWRAAMPKAQAQLNWTVEGARFAALFERLR
jgi:glycosyltransferase involved in cell wall biosynthesis